MAESGDKSSVVLTNSLAKLKAENNRLRNDLTFEKRLNNVLLNMRDFSLKLISDCKCNKNSITTSVLKKFNDTNNKYYELIASKEEEEEEEEEEVTDCTPIPRDEPKTSASNAENSRNSCEDTIKSPMKSPKSIVDKPVIAEVATNGKLTADAPEVTNDEPTADTIKAADEMLTAGTSEATNHKPTMNTTETTDNTPSADTPEDTDERSTVDATETNGEMSLDISSVETEVESPQVVCGQCGQWFDSDRDLQQHIDGVHDRDKADEDGDSPTKKDKIGSPQPSTSSSATSSPQWHSQLPQPAQNKNEEQKQKRSNYCPPVIVKRVANLSEHFNCMTSPTRTLRSVSNSPLKQSPLTYRCTKCKEKFWSESECNSHISRQHNNVQWLFPCRHCSQSFPVEDELTTHLYTVHREVMFKCHICDYQTSIKQFMNHHMDKHTVRRGRPPGRPSRKSTALAADVSNRVMTSDFGHTARTTRAKPILSKTSETDSIRREATEDQQFVRQTRAVKRRLSQTR